MQTATTQLHKRDTRFKRKSGDEVHASGTIIHWDVRAPADPYWSIGVTCHGCRQERFVPKASIKNPSWHGLCSDCLAAGKLPRKLIGKEKLKFRGEVDWDDVDPSNLRRRRVACPNVADCGNKEFKRIDAGNKNQQPFFCRSCFLEWRRSRMAGAWAAANGVPSETKTIAKRAGRPRSTDPKRILVDIERVVTSQKIEGHPRNSITSNLVASILNIGGPTGGDAMMKQVKQGIQMKWPALRDFIWDGGRVESLELIPAN
jgi:hypothetical protein